MNLLKKLRGNNYKYLRSRPKSYLYWTSIVLVGVLYGVVKNYLSSGNDSVIIFSAIVVFSTIFIRLLFFNTKS